MAVTKAVAIEAEVAAAAEAAAAAEDLQRTMGEYDTPVNEFSLSKWSSSVS